MKKTKLYGAFTVGPQSRTFYLDSQTTIVASGMFEDDQITFEILHLTDAETAQLCGCLPHELPPSAISGIQQLMCPECDEEHTLPVRITPLNPTIILEAPMGTLMRAVYHGAGLGTAQVTLISGTNTRDLTDAMRGCPPVCCEDFEQTWTDTGLVRCNNADNTIEVQQISNCGNLRWELPSTIAAEAGLPITADMDNQTWTSTGQIRCDLATDTKLIQQSNNCGDIRWALPSAIAVENGRPLDTNLDKLVWTDTGDIRCNTLTNKKYIQQLNDCGDMRWALPTTIDPSLPPEANDLVWTPTGNTQCNNMVVEDEYVNECGDTQWVRPMDPADFVTCGHIATLPLPEGGTMFPPGGQPDDATVEVTDCDEVVIGYLYPTPREGASTPVFQGCEFGNCTDWNNILGYAVDSEPAIQKTEGDVKVTSFPKRVVQALRACPNDQFLTLVWSDGSMTKQLSPCQIGDS